MGLSGNYFDPPFLPRTAPGSGLQSPARGPVLQLLAEGGAGLGVLGREGEQALDLPAAGARHGAARLEVAAAFQLLDLAGERAPGLVEGELHEGQGPGPVRAEDDRAVGRRLLFELLKDGIGHFLGGVGDDPGGEILVLEVVLQGAEQVLIGRSQPAGRLLGLLPEALEALREGLRGQDQRFFGKDRPFPQTRAVLEVLDRGDQTIRNAGRSEGGQGPGGALEQFRFFEPGRDQLRIHIWYYSSLPWRLTLNSF